MSQLQFDYDDPERSGVLLRRFEAYLNRKSETMSRLHLALPNVAPTSACFVGGAAVKLLEEKGRLEVEFLACLRDKLE